jgi:hypothetical protein
MKSKLCAKSNRLTLLLLPAALLLAGCFSWQYDVVVQGVAFSQVRVEGDGLVIGQIKADTLIGGRPCKRGWVHLRGNGVPVGFTAAREIDLGRFKIPDETWVSQNKDGVVTICQFPRDTEVQGHLCCGGGWLVGGPEGIQTEFYPDGALKKYFLRHDTRIQDIPCKAGLMREMIELHENGRLKACMLSEELTSAGRTYHRGTRLRFDPDGRIVM